MRYGKEGLIISRDAAYVNPILNGVATIIDVYAAQVNAIHFIFRFMFGLFVFVLNVILLQTNL